MIEGVPELKEKSGISLGLTIALIVAAFVVGTVFAGYLGLHVEVKAVDTKVIDEVGGLRSDWERSRKEDKEHNDAFHKYLEQEIKEAIEKHEQIHHKN